MGVQELLDAVEGVAYVVDPEGIILACSKRTWDAFLAQNNGPAALRAGAIIGQNIFAYVSGAQVAERYCSWLRALAAEDRGPLIFAYRCDAPGERREMRMAVTRLERSGQLDGFLFQSTLLAAEARPPLNIYDSASVIEAEERDAARPIVTTCSFCRRLRWPPSALPESWVEAEDYYRLGGASRVRLSHGICPDCARRLPA
jgi:hypothetical protein